MSGSQAQPGVPRIKGRDHIIATIYQVIEGVILPPLHQDREKPFLPGAI